MNGYYDQIKAVLQQHGFVLVRHKGSHQTWSKDGKPVTVSTNCRSRYTANVIMKQAGISFRF